jgi:hypothetical protein
MLLAFMRASNGAALLRSCRPATKTSAAGRRKPLPAPAGQEGRQRRAVKPGRCRPLISLVPMPFGLFPLGHAPKVRPYRRAGYGFDELRGPCSWPFKLA